MSVTEASRCTPPLCSDPYAILAKLEQFEENGSGAGMVCQHVWCQIPQRFHLWLCSSLRLSARYHKVVTPFGA